MFCSIFNYYCTMQISNVYLNLYGKFSYQSNALCWLIVKLKKKISIPDQDLNPGL